MRLLKVAVRVALGAMFAAVLLVSAPAQAQGPHFMSEVPECTVTGTTVTCEGSDIAGVGNLNAVATLTVVYSGTVECTNPGGQVVEAHETSFSESTSSGTIRSKNGRLTVPELSESAPTELTREQEDQFCPNPRWDARLVDVQLVSFEYTIVFVDKRGNVVEEFFTITGP